MDAYAKIYAPPEEPKPETEVETEASIDDVDEYDANGNLIDLETQEAGND